MCTLCVTSCTSNYHYSNNKQQQQQRTFWPLHRSTCISCYPHLQTGGIQWSKFYCSLALANSNRCIRKRQKMLAFSSAALSAPYNFQFHYCKRCAVKTLTHAAAFWIYFSGPLPYKHSDTIIPADTAAISCLRMTGDVRVTLHVIVGAIVRVTISPASSTHRRTSYSPAACCCIPQHN